VVINANDVAVLGVRPRWFLACVLVPPETREAEVRAVFKGMRAALASIDAVLVGGHTEVTDVVTQPVVVGQMLGLREDGRFVRTGGVGETDAVLQVGPAPIEGAAVLAREADERLCDVPEAVIAAARRALRDPGISVVEAALRAAELGATALHDPTEGGLSAGLHELAEASGVALRVDAAGGGGGRRPGGGRACRRHDRPCRAGRGRSTERRLAAPALRARRAVASARGRPCLSWVLPGRGDHGAHGAVSWGSSAPPWLPDDSGRIRARRPQRVAPGDAPRRGAKRGGARAPALRGVFG
jgi:hypothetical protein